MYISYIVMMMMMIVMMMIKYTHTVKPPDSQKYFFADF